MRTVLFIASVLCNLLIVSIEAESERASPPKVVEKNISFILFIISLLPTIADIGIPLAIDLPKVDKSGVTLYSD